MKFFHNIARCPPPQGLSRTFGGICDALDVIQVAADHILDPARRLVGYMVALKTALVHVRYQK